MLDEVGCSILLSFRSVLVLPVNVKLGGLTSSPCSSSISNKRSGVASEGVMAGL